MTSVEGDVSGDLVLAGLAAERRIAFDVPDPVYDAGAVLKCHDTAHAQILPDRNARREVDGLEVAIERFREAKAALLTVGELDAGEAARLPRSTRRRHKRGAVDEHVARDVRRAANQRESEACPEPAHGDADDISPRSLLRDGRNRTIGAGLEPRRCELHRHPGTTNGPPAYVFKYKRSTTR